MRTGNPALKSDTFTGYGEYTDISLGMTIQGTVNKTGLLLLLVLGASIWTWRIYFTSGNYQTVIPWVIGGTIGGFILALLTIFKMPWAPVTAPIYALCEGFALGGISSVFESSYPGIVVQAVALTFGTLLCLLVAYKTGLIKATEHFKLGIISANRGNCPHLCPRFHPGSVWPIHTVYP